MSAIAIAEKNRTLIAIAQISAIAIAKNPTIAIAENPTLIAIATILAIQLR